MGKYHFVVSVDEYTDLKAMRRFEELYAPLSDEQKGQVNSEWETYRDRNAAQGTLMLPMYLWMIGRLG